MRHVALAAIVASLCVSAVVEVRAQPAPAREPDQLQGVLSRLEQIVQAGDVFGYLDLVTGTANRSRAIDFSRSEIQPGATRTVIKERDRVPFGSNLDPDGYRVIVDVFVEFGARAREATWRLDLQRIGGVWQIFDEERLTVVDRLYRIALERHRQFNALNLVINVEDLDIVLETGSVFFVSADTSTTGLVLVGRGEMRFHPRPATEKGQVKIFCGNETLVTPFSAAFVRTDPSEFERLVASDRLTETPVNPRDLRRATDVFEEDFSKSYHLGLGDLSADPWSLLPGAGNFVAELHTRRFGTLTYVRSKAEPEDITLFDRVRHRNIAVYASEETLARRGRFYNEDDRREYDVIDYDLDLAVSPGREWLDGVVTVRMLITADVISTVQLKLADSLVVRSITSDRFGRLFGFRVNNQNVVVVNLPASLPRGAQLKLTFVYSGRVQPQSMDGLESVGVGGQEQSFEAPEMTAEPNYLYSNRVAWYPQATTSDYATAIMKISVPPSYSCVASGVLDSGWPQLAGDKADQTERRIYSFSASQPLRYLAFIVSKFVHADTRSVAFELSRGHDTLALSVEANSRQVKTGQNLAERAADIAKFYVSLAGDVPYPTFTIAVTEGNLPGGHSPAYFAQIVQQLPFSGLIWRNDPAAFDRFPDFFIAHELAHQWFGQAVGWGNYHEQWLSEGFAQYFAALYAQHQRGDGVFAGVLRQMRRWAMRESDQGPVYLGYRLGHIQGDPRIFRALVYNKGAAVLHMLRRLIGDDAFFRGVRRFYASSRFRKVGTDELRQAFEAEAGRPLDRFFDQWIYGSTLPQLKVRHHVEGAELVVHVDQIGEVFEVPVTLTLQYAGGRKSDVVVPVTSQSTDRRIPLVSTLQSVSLNRDDGILADISQ